MVLTCVQPPFSVDISQCVCTAAGFSSVVPQAVHTSERLHGLDVTAPLMEEHITVVLADQPASFQREVGPTPVDISAT
jgi:hypothetical protein